MIPCKFREEEPFGAFCAMVIKETVKKAKYEKGQEVRVIGPNVVTTQKLSDIGWTVAMNKMAGKVRKVEIVVYNPMEGNFHYALETEKGEINWSYDEKWLEAVRDEI